MSKQNKWSGNFGKQASGGSSTMGGNGSGGVRRASAPQARTGADQNVVTKRTGPGDNLGNRDNSTHNDINTFTRGIKSRGPYTGPSFASMNNSEKYMKMSDTAAKSMARNPSGGGGMTRGMSGDDNASVRQPGQTGGNITGGQSFASINNTKKSYQSSNTKSISSFNLPSSGPTGRGNTGGSGTGLTKAPVRTGSGRAQATKGQSSPKSNKDGSGYQASVR